jgi:cyclopropane-fatty-acyl-phospholipid synthase
MGGFDGMLERKLAAVGMPIAVVLPDGRHVGAEHAPVTLRLKAWGPLAHLAAGEVGKVAQDHVEGRIDLDGSPRDLMAIAARLVDDDPTRPSEPAPLTWWRDRIRGVRSRRRHVPQADAEQVRFHYDLQGSAGDAFYALWLDPLRVYSCAYYRDAGMDLAAAQQAKLDHVCRKLMLREGERFLDIGAGWGGLLMWAAEHYGVCAHGVTLSRNQHAHVQRLIDARGLSGRVSVALADYRELSGNESWDKIASIGMFEHVGHAGLPGYFRKIRQLLRPGGLLMNHGITAAGTRNAQLGAGMGEFIERYIFPGGELLHVSHALRVLSEAGLETLDVESLRPHYARTLWDWSDALEARLDQARALVPDSVVRAYRLYLAGCAMSFEQGWISLFQTLASRPTGDPASGPMRGAQCDHPFQRGHVYRDPHTPCSTSSSPRPPATSS